MSLCYSVAQLDNSRDGVPLAENEQHPIERNYS